jgi:hypothetical protein
MCEVFNYLINCEYKILKEEKKIVINNKQIRLEEKILKNKEIIKNLINEINEIKEKYNNQNEKINELIKENEEKEDKLNKLEAKYNKLEEQINKLDEKKKDIEKNNLLEKENNLLKKTNISRENNKKKKNNIIIEEESDESEKEDKGCWGDSIGIIELAEELRIGIDVYTKTVKELSQLIYEKLHIPKYRQSFFYNEEKIIIDNERRKLDKLEDWKLSFRINLNTQEKDWVYIEVKDKRFCTPEKFELKLDIYGDILGQISKFKNISPEYLYLLYDKKVLYEYYLIYKDNFLGKKIILELYNTNIYDESMKLFVKTYNERKINLYVAPNESIISIKLKIQR